jgi:exodeoxyribonuclease V alpha subunit
MHGGVKVYRGTPSAARAYLETESRRADDYYLREGTGVAEHLRVDHDGRVVELPGLTGERYEAWVAGVDPDSGEPRGQLRGDGHAVRFAEIVVNGPKSWSLAAELHPDIAAAYEAAQDRAARQILAWLGEHATTRVGPRGAQVAVPVERLEAAVIRHYTSRAGDPHRHLHLQVNARVFAAGKWRGLDTVAVRDSIQAINGIGHAAVACDPDFRAALAAHGYTLTGDGEIAQLAPIVGAFSKRAAQIGRLIDRYEANWRTAHPSEEPGPGLRRAWDARAWAQDRPDKVVPRDGAELRRRWLDELHQLGYRDRDRPVQLALPLPGAIDRNAAAAEVITRLGARHSAWNAADVRGEVEQLLARAGVIAEPAVRGELAEDLTARALDQCVPLHDGALPEHVRAWTSRHVLDVETDLVTRFAERGAEPLVAATAPAEGLDPGQQAAVAALTSDAGLVVVEGAAGAGKTTTLAAVRDALAAQDQRLVVVTPTLKAAQAASAEIGARAGSAAWLAYQHGWRWDEHGTWTRVPADPAPGAVLRRGDLLLCDEAGMLDQDTARALLTIADETGARVALVGDRHQLAAVGRGGVLDLAHRWAHPAARVELDTVHRFVRTIDGGVTVADSDYAALSLAMRTGEDPAAVFDQLAERGQIGLHASETARYDELADQVAAASAAGAGLPAVLVDTRDQAAALNSAIRDRLVTAGRVDDQHTTSGRDGQRLGAGDRIVTRRNDPALGVANRETWTVTAVGADGRLTVTDPGRGRRELPARYVAEHVELGCAVTGYGAQGDTSGHGHLLVSEHTSAAQAYVGMTRGRWGNTSHLVAADLDHAREQWVAVFARDRADLGPTAATIAAERAAVGYTPPRPLPEIAAQLWTAWDQRAEAELVLRHYQPLLDRALATRPRRQAQHAAQQAARALVRDADKDLAAARDRLAELDHEVGADAARIAAQIEQAWAQQRDAARTDALRIQHGVGRFGRGRAALQDATDRLEQWADAWQPIIGDLHQHWFGPVGFAAAHPSNDHIEQAVRDYARTQAARAHPEHAAQASAVSTLQQRAAAAAADYEAQRDRHAAHAHPGDYLLTPDRVARLRHALDLARQQTEHADQSITSLRRDVAHSSPDPNQWLDDQHTAWRVDHHRRRLAQQRARAAQLDPISLGHRGPTPAPGPYQPYTPAPSPGHGIGR